MNSAADGRRGSERGDETFATRQPAAGKATILLFPLARQRVLVAQLASKMLNARTDDAAERVLQKRLAQLGRSLCAKRAIGAAINRQVGSFEAAVRTELWRLMFPTPAGRRKP